MPQEPFDVIAVKHIKRRLIKLRQLPRFPRRGLGIIIFIIGLITFIFPLPGSWLLILAGLALLSRDFWLFLEIKYRSYLKWRTKSNK